MAGEAASQEVNELKQKGITVRGYGHIAKAVMTDRDLSLASKGLYGYFSSYRGSGNSKIFPSRDRILADLKIGKDAYYNYLRPLTDMGYITINQDFGKNPGKGFITNEFIIEEIPAKYLTFEESLSEADRKCREKIAEAKSIDAGGYGISPKLIMEDSTLSIQAKGLYCYFASFAGAGLTASPKKEDALAHLGISTNSFDKYVKELLSKNYLDRSRDKNDFGKMIYRIVFNPEDNHKNPDTMESGNHKNPDTINTDNHKIADTIKNENHRNTDTIISDGHKNSDIINPPDNNNSKITNNSLNTINQPEDKKTVRRRRTETDRVIEKPINQLYDELFEAVSDAVDEEGGIPYSFVGNSEKLSVAVRYVSDWDHFSNRRNYLRMPDGDFRYELYNLYIECLEEMLAEGATTNIKGGLFSYAKILDAFNKNMSTVGTDGRTTASDVPVQVIDKFIECAKTTKIKNYKAYLKSLIYTVLTTSKIDEAAMIYNDFKKFR